MALHWLHLSELPGATFTRAGHAAGTLVDGVIHITGFSPASSFDWGAMGPWKGRTGCPGSGESGPRAHTVSFVDTPGYAFTGRHRLVLLEVDIPCVELLAVHFENGGGGWCPHTASANIPPGTYTYETVDAPCLALLDGTGMGYSTTLFSEIRLHRQDGDISSMNLRYRLEFEVDYDPPPPAPFWQDFIGCKEITP